MDAFKLQTLADLLVFPEERVELIGGEIVRRPMARFAHGRAQGCTFRHLGAFDSGSGPGGGWWIATEISVAYEAHECPSHDLAGCRDCPTASSTCRRTGSARSFPLAMSTRTPAICRCC